MIPSSLYIYICKSRSLDIKIDCENIMNLKKKKTKKQNKKEKKKKKKKKEKNNTHKSNRREENIFNYLIYKKY